MQWWWVWGGADFFTDWLKGGPRRHRARIRRGRLVRVHPELTPRVGGGALFQAPSGG